MYNGFNRSSIGRIHVLATFLSLACVQCDGANIEWNTFDVYDFSSWEVGLRLVQSGLLVFGVSKGVRLSPLSLEVLLGSSPS